MPSKFGGTHSKCHRILGARYSDVEPHTGIVIQLNLLPFKELAHIASRKDK